MIILISKDSLSVRCHLDMGLIPDIIACPTIDEEWPGKKVRTSLWIGDLLDKHGTMIPAAERAKNQHVTQIVSRCLRKAGQETGNVAILSADCFPDAGWMETLSESVTGKVGMVSGVVPTDSGFIKGFRKGRQLTTGVLNDPEPFEVDGASFDLCVLSERAVQALRALTGNQCFEIEAGQILRDLNMSVLIDPRVECDHVRA